MRLLTIVSTFLFCLPAHAFSCGEDDPHARIEQADLIILARATSVKTVPQEKKLPTKAAEAVVEVERVLKGDLKPKRPLTIDLMQVYAFPNLTPGTQYVLFLTKDLARDSYALGECSTYFGVNNNTERYEELLTQLNEVL